MNTNTALTPFLIRDFCGDLTMVPVGRICAIAQLSESYVSPTQSEGPEYVRERLAEGCHVAVETRDATHYSKETFESCWRRYATCVGGNCQTLDAATVTIDMSIEEGREP